jgi:hypothetical protein
MNLDRVTNAKRRMDRGIGLVQGLGTAMIVVVGISLSFPWRGWVVSIICLSVFWSIAEIACVFLIGWTMLLYVEAGYYDHYLKGSGDLHADL